MRVPVVVGSLVALAAAAFATPTDSGATPPELLAAARQFREWRREASALPDIAARVAELRRGVAEHRNRLLSLPREGWPVSAKVDFLVVRSELDHLDFDLQVIREPSRNPDFYVGEAVTGVTRHIGGRYQSGTGVTVPYDAERSEAILAALEATPGITAQAPSLLTEAEREMADVAIERLDGVAQGYRELAQVLTPHFPESLRGRLSAAAESAGKALSEYRAWLVTQRDALPPYRPIGSAAFEWYAARVLGFPYDSEELLGMAAMERDRGWAFLQLARQRNRHLPPLEVARSNEEYSEWKDATDVLSRLWAEDHDLFTRPDYVGPIRDAEGGVWVEPFGMMAFPREALPADGKTEFLVAPDHPFSQIYWEVGHRLDPGTNHPHSDYPGHTFEGKVSQRTTSEIRRGHRSRGDSWCYYMEEVQLQLDYPFVRGPRVHEWMYSLHIMRAERVHVAVEFASGAMEPDAVPAYMMDSVPWMEPHVARKHELWRKYTDPGQVLTYQVGRTEVYKLLGRVMREQGDSFDLRRFHDELLATGQIPITFAAWEMTGEPGRVERIWEHAPIPVGAAGQAGR